jgi:hypothetical protein
MLILIAAGVGTPWRPLLALWFVLICPGASLVGVLGLRNSFAELSLIAPLSLILVTLTSVILFYGGLWSLKAEFGLLLGLCLAGLVCSDLRRRYDRRGDA